jgi:hypothetical protein
MTVGTMAITCNYTRCANGSLCQFIAGIETWRYALRRTVCQPLVADLPTVHPQIIASALRPFATRAVIVGIRLQ